jgi:nitrogen fixation protein NifU and related proteins
MTAREVHAGEASAPVPVAADLYQRIVLDHSRDPRNFRRLPGANREAVGHNRLCGDKVTVYLRVAGDRIAEASFEGAGCAICMASASLLTEAVTGAATGAADALAVQVVGHLDQPDGQPPLPGPLAALDGVRAYPSRVRCATLPWQTLHQAITAPGQGPVTTETLHDQR